MRDRAPITLSLLLCAVACPTADDAAATTATEPTSTPSTAADQTTSGTQSSSSPTPQTTSATTPTTTDPGTVGSDTEGATGSETDPKTDSEGSTGGGEPICEAAAQSLCGSEASIIRGTVELPGGERGSGDLVIALMHRRYGKPENGGHPHWMWTFQDVDLREPYSFEIDMCEGNAVMWSEENCEYNLIAILDTNANNGLAGSRGAVPDLDEPTSVHVMDLSCHAEGATCVSLTLDCVAGAECVDYEDPGDCACAENACPSESAICAL